MDRVSKARDQRLTQLWVATLLMMMSVTIGAAEGMESPPNGYHPIGFVVALEGTWLLESGSIRTVVSGGQELPEDGRLRAISKRALLRIAFCDGTSNSYQRPGNYKDPISLQAPPACTGPSLPQRFLRALAKFSLREVTYVPTLSRGARIVELQDAVLEEHGAAFDLRAVFGKVPPGAYPLRVQVASLGTQALEWTTVSTVSWTWNPEAPATVELPAGFHAGLWRIAMAESSPLSGDAWVLVCSREDYQSRAAAYRQALESANWWGHDLQESEIRGRLRAYLEALEE
jgi:hypothetical protein